MLRSGLTVRSADAAVACSTEAETMSADSNVRSNITFRLTAIKHF